MERSRRFGIAAVLLCAACSDPAGSQTALEIRLQDAEPIRPQAAADGSVQCGLQLDATASGAGRARWLGSRFRYLDASTGRLLGSGEWDAEGVRGFWGAEEIVAGETRRSTPGAIGGPRPFVFEAAFDYTLSDPPAVHTVWHRFTCDNPPRD